MNVTNVKNDKQVGHNNVSTKHLRNELWYTNYNHLKFCYNKTPIQGQKQLWSIRLCANLYLLYHDQYGTL